MVLSLRLPVMLAAVLAQVKSVMSPSLSLLRRLSVMRLQMPPLWTLELPLAEMSLSLLSRLCVVRVQNLQMPPLWTSQLPVVEMALAEVGALVLALALVFDTSSFAPAPAPDPPFCVTEVEPH